MTFVTGKGRRLRAGAVRCLAMNGWSLPRHTHKQPLCAPPVAQLSKVVEVCQRLPQVVLQHSARQLQPGHQQRLQRWGRQVQRRQPAVEPGRSGQRGAGGVRSKALQGANMCSCMQLVDACKPLDTSHPPSAPERHGSCLTTAGCATAWPPHQSPRCCPTGSCPGAPGSARHGQRGTPGWIVRGGGMLVR